MMFQARSTAMKVESNDSRIKKFTVAGEMRYALKQLINFSYSMVDFAKSENIFKIGQRIEELLFDNLFSLMEKAIDPKFNEFQSQCKNPYGPIFDQSCSQQFSIERERYIRLKSHTSSFEQAYFPSKKKQNLIARTKKALQQIRAIFQITTSENHKTTQLIQEINKKTSFLLESQLFREPKSILAML